MRPRLLPGVGICWPQFIRVWLCLAADKNGISPNAILLSEHPGSIERLAESFQNGTRPQFELSDNGSIEDVISAHVFSWLLECQTNTHGLPGKQIRFTRHRRASSVNASAATCL